MKYLKIILVCCLPLVIAGCGGHPKTVEPKSETPVRLILDYLPNTLHIAYYSALDQGYYKDNGLKVEIMAPTSTTDTLRLMSAGQAEFGMAPLIDVVNARCNGEPVVILSGLVQTPLAAVITTEKTGIKRPKDFEGRLIGTTGIAGDEIIISSMMINDGADPARARFMNIGYNQVQSLAAGQIDAVIGFWSQEAIMFAQQSKDKPVVIRLENFGFPKFPEIVLFCREDLLKKNPDLVRKFLAASSKGMAWAYANEDAALNGLSTHVEGMKPAELRTYFDALKPVFTGDNPAYGYMDVPGIQTYSEWATKIKLLNLSEPVSKFVTNEYLPTK
jgi:putative hydroxymethylpyrimidine transport system substrate-binding protein